MALPSYDEIVGEKLPSYDEVTSPAQPSYDELTSAASAPPATDTADAGTDLSPEQVDYKNKLSDLQTYYQQNAPLRTAVKTASDLIAARPDPNIRPPNEPDVPGASFSKYADYQTELRKKFLGVKALGPAFITDERGNKVPEPPLLPEEEKALAEQQKIDREKATADAEAKRQANIKTLGGEPNALETFTYQLQGKLADMFAETMRTFAPSNLYGNEQVQEAAAIAHDANVAAGLGKGITQDVARGTADVLALMSGTPAGKAGIIHAAIRGAAEARNRVLDETGDPEKADAAATNSLITLPILLATGTAASKFASGLLPKEASALAKGATELGAGATANVGTDLLIHAVQGQPYDWRSFTTDALFALHGAWSRYAEAAKAKGDTGAAETATKAADTISEEIKTKTGDPNAIPIESSNGEVLRNESPGTIQGVGLQGVGESNAQSESPATAQGGLAPDAQGQAQQIVPAIKVGDEVVKGNPGETHKDILDRYIAENPDKAGDALSEFDTKKNPNFFLDPDGQPISREQLKQQYGVSDSQGLRDLQAQQKTAAPEHGEQPVVPPDSSVSKWTGATDPVRLRPLPGSKAAGTTLFGDIGAVARRGLEVAKNKIFDLAEWTPFRAALLDWSATHQKITADAKGSFRDITKAVPDAAARDGITNWIQAGGDATELAKRAAATKDPTLKKGYEAALKLTPDQIKVANDVKGAYEALLKRANSYGINIAELPNYVNQLWQRSPMTGLFRGRALKATTQHQKARFYDNYFAGEQAGLKPATKDIGKLLPMYINDVNRAIADKQLVQRLATAKAEDGRPLLAPRGNLGTVDTDTGKAYFVKPETQNEDIKDYRNLEQPALHSWRWQGKDEAGNPIFVKSDLVVHPDIAQHLKNVLNQQKPTFRDNPVAATLDAVNTVQSYLKQTMLGFFSPFHTVTEAIHAVGHKINPLFNIEKVDLNNPAHLDAAQHGLMLGPDRVSQNDFMEGLAGGNKNILANIAGKIPGLKWIKTANDAIQNWMFESYIPSLKLKTYNAVLERNTARYKDDIALGKVSLDQVKHLTGEQVNAAYGHLNYTDMGRNPTLQKFLRLTLLAPDFLEARGRFAGQALKGAVGSKSGREQLAALGFIGAALYLSARVTNQLVDKDPHWDDPFGVHIGNRRYTVRSVPGDIVELFKDQRKFVSGRLSPLVGKGTLEALSGVNYRGEKVGGMEILKDVASGSIPLTLQPFTRGLSDTTKNNPVSIWEQLTGAIGVHVNRISPINDAYKLGSDWKEKQGIPKDKGTYPVSKYQQLRYALEDNDPERAKAEVAKLKAEVKDKSKVASGFKESLNHPFTDTEANDQKMRRSLSPEDRAKFDAAVKRRQEIWARFQRLR